MTALRCDACGAGLSMDESGNFAVCEYCGMKHTKERITVKVQEIKGVVEITKGEGEKSRLLENARYFISTNNIQKALKTINILLLEFPMDFDVIQLSRELDNIVMLEDSKTKWKQFIQAVESVLQEAQKQRPKNGVVFGHLDYMFFQATHLLPDNQKYIYIQRKNEYYDSIFKNIYNGKLTISEIDVDCFYFDVYPYENDLLLKTITNGVQEASIISDLDSWYGKPYCFINGVVYFINRGHHTKTENDVISQSHFRYECSSSCFDLFDVSEYENAPKISGYKSPVELVNFIKFDTQRKNLCMHCLGKFEGYFKQKCSKCGKPKNY